MRTEIQNKIRQLKNNPWFGQKEKLPFDQAQVEDIYYCYRLLLKREPDESGWNDWFDLVTNHKINIQTLVDGFLYSQEFEQLQEEAFKPKLVDCGDFKIYVRENDYFIGGVIAREKEYEAYVSNELRKLLKPGDVFVDIGANIGYFSILAAAIVGQAGSVFAFEPNPNNCLLFEKSISTNGFSNITLFPYAVAEAEQQFNLDVGGSNSNGRIIDFSPQAVPGASKPILVEAVVLDKILEDVNQVNLIKMDIEGAEPRAWQGMQKIIRKNRPILVFEYSPDLIEITSHVPAETFLDSINEQGYDIFILDRFQPKSTHPQSKQEIINRQIESKLTHLDLVAYPH